MYLFIIIAVGIAIAFTMRADALVMLGGGVTDIRGSIAGTTFSRSKAGNIARSRKKPVNPRAPLQNTRRSEIAYLARFWSHNLNEQQRTDWRAYATGTTWTNKLGQTIEIGGNAAFIRLNAIRRILGRATRLDAPTAMGHAGGNTFTFAAETDTTKLQIDEPVGAFDKDNGDSIMAFFCGLPSQPGRLATPKGFKYCGYLVGHAVTPPTFPYELTAPYTMAAGQIITIRVMFADEHFRISGPHWATDIAAPAA